MKINGYILANRTQEVPIPIPIEPVEAAFTASNIVYPYMMLNARTQKSADLTNTRTPQKQLDDSSGEYYKEQGYDAVPCNWGGSSSGGIATLYPSSDMGNSYTDLEIYSPKGDITLTIGNTLTPGKYCFQMLFWLGFEDALGDTSGTAFKGHVAIDSVKDQIVKQGTNGIIHAKVIDADGVIYEGAQISIYQDPKYRGNCVCVQVRYVFEIAEGDTTKTFSFGNGTEFSFTELYRSIKMWETTSDYANRGSAWANCVFLMNLKLFTAQ